MSGSGEIPRGAVVALLALVPGCLNAAEVRAERDERVGRAEGDALSISIAEGHAAIRHLAPDELELWGSVPAFTARLTPKQPVTEFRIELHNLMPGTEVRMLDRSSAEIGELDWDSSTRAHFVVSGLSEPIGLRIGPPDADAPEPFRFGLLSDVQEAIDGLQDIIVRINAEPDLSFVLGAGDLTEDGKRDELIRFQRELESMNVPYYPTLGNHEINANPPLYHDYFGRGNLSFEYKQVRFTLLDSASATIDTKVYDWLGSWLAAGREQTHVVAMHIPPMDPTGTRNGGFASRSEAAKLLNQLAAARVDLTLYGHIHTYVDFENAGIDAHIAGGGGAIPNHGDGIGRHYMVIEADSERILRTDVREVDGDWDY